MKKSLKKMEKQLAEYDRQYAAAKDIGDRIRMDSTKTLKDALKADIDMQRCIQRAKQLSKEKRVKYNKQVEEAFKMPEHAWSDNG